MCSCSQPPSYIQLLHKLVVTVMYSCMYTVFIHLVINSYILNQLYKCLPYSQLASQILNLHGLSQLRQTLTDKPRSTYYAQIFTYHAFEQCSKDLPIMFNIMPMTSAIIPQFVYDFIIFNDQLGSITYQFRLQCSYFWPIMLNIMLIRKLVHPFVPNQHDYCIIKFFKDY